MEVTRNGWWWTSRAKGHKRAGSWPQRSCRKVFRTTLPSGLGKSKGTGSADAADHIVTVHIARVCHDPHVSPSLCRASTGPCSATKDAINTLISLTLSAAAGRRLRSPWVLDHRWVNPYPDTWCSCVKSHTPPRLLGEDPAPVSQGQVQKCSKMNNDKQAPLFTPFGKIPRVARGVDNIDY